MSTPVLVELTELRKLSGILTKKITLGEDGKPKSDGSGCRLTVGMARRNRMNGGDPAGALARLPERHGQPDGARAGLHERRRGRRVPGGLQEAPTPTATTAPRSSPGRSTTSRSPTGRAGR